MIKVEIPLNGTALAGGEGGGSVEVRYEEVAGMAGGIIMYYRSKELGKEESEGGEDEVGLLGVPDAHSDAGMLRMLWRRGVLRLREGLRGQAEVEDIGDEESPGIRVTSSVAIGVNRRKELREQVVFMLAASIVSDWLFITAHKEIPHFSEIILTALGALRRLLPAGAAARARRRASPF